MTIHELISRLCSPMCINLVLTVAVMFAPAPSPAVQAGRELTLAYYRVIDKSVYTKAPSNFQHVIYRGSWGQYEIFAEKYPSHQIPVSGIVSVTVGKTKKVGNSQADERELERIAKEIEKGRVIKRTQEDYTSGFYYSITYKLTLSEWKRYVAFNNANLKGSFQVKIGTRDLGVLPFLVAENAAQGTEFTIDTQEESADRIKEWLAPLANKVIWE
jgi:hypothetical protein